MRHETFSRRSILSLLGASCALPWLSSSAGARSVAPRPNDWRELLEDCRVGSPQTRRALTLFPLLASGEELPNHWVLKQALRQDAIEIREISEAGTVNTLEVESLGSRPVLICAGEILTGAKQDRILKHDLWLSPERGPVKVQAYCVERDRWAYHGSSRKFSNEETWSNISVREAAQVAGAQDAVWQNVDSTVKASGMAGRRPTASIQHAYRDPELQRQLRSMVEAFSDMPAQYNDLVGAVVVIGRRVHLVELLPDHSTLERLWESLVRSYALEALAQPRLRTSSESSPSEWHGKVTSLVRNCANLQAGYLSTPGSGTLMSLSDSRGRSRGEVLQLSNQVVHLQVYQPNTLPAERPKTDWPSAQDLIRPKSH